ncbi:MAG: hypothetical protein AB7S26_09125 [Sandaracinaceae bacterium]
MISDSLRFEGFDSRSWTNLISLFAPNVLTRIESEEKSGEGIEAEPDQKDRTIGSLVVVLDDRDRVLMAMHSVRGRVTGLEYAGVDSLEELAHRYAARRCVVLREGVMEEISERVAHRIERGDDYITQLLVVARAVREMSEAGLLVTWPRALADVPIPTAPMVRRALDTILPDEHAMALVVWNAGAPWTGAVLRRRAGAIDLLAGPDLIGRWTGPLGGDWRRDHRVISDAVGRAVAPVHLGVYAERSTLRALLRSTDPGAWAQAVAVRDVIVHPTPAYVAVALGADAFRAAAKSSARWLGGIDAFAQLAPVATYVRGQLAHVASINATLGFDPLKLLAASLRRAEDAALDAEAAEAHGAPRASAPSTAIDDEEE